MQLLFNIGFIDFGFPDVIDILLVTFLLYQLYKLLKGSVAVNIFLGLLAIYLFYAVVKALDMSLLSAILGEFIGVGVIAAVVLFQQEIRKFLLYIGKTATSNEKLKEVFNFSRSTEDANLPINTIVKAASEMAFQQVGALIVISKSDELKFYEDTGDILDAIISKRLLLSIFNTKSPLHDGAVIVHHNRITAARCILPVSENDELPAHYGLRHRAALGLSEVSDSIIIVVSEETGKMSLVHEGEIEYDMSSSQLRSSISHYLLSRVEEEKELEVANE